MSIAASVSGRTLKCARGLQVGGPHPTERSSSLAGSNSAGTRTRTMSVAGAARAPKRRISDQRMSQRRGLTIHSPPSTGTGMPCAVASIESARRSTSAHLTVRRTPMTTPRDQLFTRRMCNPEVASYARGAVPASWCDSRSKDYWSVGRAEGVRSIAAMSRPRKSALTCRPSVGVLLPAGCLSNAQLCHRNRGQIHELERSHFDTLPQWLVPDEKVSR